LPCSVRECRYEAIQFVADGLIDRDSQIVGAKSRQIYHNILAIANPLTVSRNVLVPSPSNNAALVA
jgi:hypothetical protein